MPLLLLILLFCSHLLVADYGWMPKEENLELKLGWELFKSENNFLVEGEKAGLTFNGSPSTLTENRFALDLEYGLSDVWSALLRTGYLNVGVAPQGPSGSGLFDTFSGFKWQAKKSSPLIALEGGLVFAPYSVDGMDFNEIAVGDGVSGMLTKLHVGTKLNRFTFSVSPGLYLRFGRFSHQLLIEGAISRVFRKIFLRGFFNSGFSINRDSVLSLSAENTEAGSGGSFSRLSPSPDSFSAGLRIGWFLSRKFRLESSIQQTLSGKASADGYRLGVQLVSLIDFHVPDTREPISEVPLNSD